MYLLVKIKLFKSFGLVYMVVSCGRYHLMMSTVCSAWRTVLRWLLSLPFLLPFLNDRLPILFEICKRSARFILACLGSHLVSFVARHILTDLSMFLAVVTWFFNFSKIALVCLFQCNSVKRWLRKVGGRKKSHPSEKHITKILKNCIFLIIITVTITCMITARFCYIILKKKHWLPPTLPNQNF